MMKTIWKIKLTVNGNVDLNNSKFYDVLFNREDNKNFAILEVEGDEKEVLDVALAKVNRVLDRLSFIYNEGLVATKNGAIANYLRGPRVIKKDNSGVHRMDSFVEVRVKLLKDKRHRDSTKLQLIGNFKGNDEILCKLLGYYNKGLKAIDTDSFNAFTSFWGVFETCIKLSGKKEVKRQDFINFLQSLRVDKKEVDKLYGNYRSAIAHSEYDVSSLYSISKVTSKISRIRELAIKTIERFLSTAN